MKDYLLGLAAAALSVSILSSFLRKGALRQVFLLAGGVFLTVQVLSPLVRGELSRFSQYLAGMELRQDAMESGIEVENREIMAAIMKEKTEAYILDKAAALGAEVEAEVEVLQGDHYPYPWSCVIRGVLNAEQQRQLGFDLEHSLGIAEERQVYLP